jgi:prepilin-type N-terminal cleavage/methylation domain-containing protein
VQRGFTLVELVTAMVIALVLAAALFPRAPSTESATISPRALQLASDIRYVQTLSMTSGSRYCVVIAANAYEIQTTTNNVCNAGAGTRQANPAGLGQSAPISLCSGCTVSATTLQFDGMGAPRDSSGAVLSGNTVITFTDSGNTRTITVSPTTGRVICNNGAASC